MNQIIQFLTLYGGLILFVTAFVEQSGLPVPAAPWLLAAGALAAGGHMSLLAAICWAAIGSLAADVTWFSIGHHGKGWVLKLFPRLRTVHSVTTRRTRFCSMARGLRILTAAKFLPFGTVVPLRAGALNVNLLRFVVFDAISSVVYASAYVLLGLFFHEQLEEAAAWVQRLGLLALVLLVVLIGGYATFRFLKRRQPKPAEPVEPGNKLEASHV
jgi:membrane protein DedA with SNARE-associated domain